MILDLPNFADGKSSPEFAISSNLANRVCNLRNNLNVKT
jgi:hypothetical protein